MILSVCPNPCIDYTVEIDSLNIGKLNRVDNKMLNYSGKALNVAVGIARLGEEVLASGFMFESEGKIFEERLNKEGVRTNFIWNEGSVRLNYKIIDKKSMLTEINDKGEKVSRQKQLELIRLIQEKSTNAKVVVMSGSLPSGVESSFYNEIFSVVPKTAFKICDAEKNNMLEAFKCGIDLVKPNLSELEGVVGKKLRTKTEILDGAHGLIDLGVKSVIVSLGREGAIFTNGKDNLFCKSMNVAVNSTVGAGDAMLSAVSVAVEKGCDNKEMLKMAVSAGTAAVTTSGSSLFYKDKYEEVYNNITVTNL